MPQVDYPAACNAVEKVLVHKAWVDKGGLTHLADALTQAGVEVHAGAQSAISTDWVEWHPCVPAPACG